MSFNPFSAPQNYSEMLAKISAATFLLAVGATWIVRSQVSEVEAFLKPFDLKVDVGGVSIAIGYVLPALVVATLFRMVKAHDRLSDVFGVRHRFDVYQILLPLAGGADVPIALVRRKRIESERNRLMSELFYEYVSSTSPNPAVDRHLIVMALDQWHWYWILIEAMLVAAIAAVLFAVAQKWPAVAAILAGLLLVQPLLRYLLGKCARYAHDEVIAILREPTRKARVRDSFSAL